MKMRGLKKRTEGKPIKSVRIDPDVPDYAHAVRWWEEESSEQELPMIYFIHRDSDRNDKELVNLMIAFEEAPQDAELILKIIEKRYAMGDPEIAKKWVDYAFSKFDDTFKRKIEELRERFEKPKKE